MPKKTSINLGDKDTLPDEALLKNAIFNFVEKGPEDSQYDFGLDQQQIRELITLAKSGELLPGNTNSPVVITSVVGNLILEALNHTNIPKNIDQ